MSQACTTGVCQQTWGLPVRLPVGLFVELEVWRPLETSSAPSAQKTEADLMVLQGDLPGYAHGHTGDLCNSGGEKTNAVRKTQTCTQIMRDAWSQTV